MRILASTLASFLGSAICVGTGVMMVSEGDPAPLLIGFGVATLGYGLSSLLLLLLAWVQPAQRLPSIARATGIAFFLLWLVGSLDHRGLQGLEWVGVVAVAAIVAVNRGAVRSLVEARLPPQRAGFPPA